MPSFTLHFTDAWLTFLFGLGGVGYFALMGRVGSMKIDIERIKTILRINTDEKIVLPERFKWPQN